MKFEELKKSQLLRIEAALVEVLEEAIEFCGSYSFKKTDDGKYEFSSPVSVFNIEDGLKVFEKFSKTGQVNYMRLYPSAKDKMLLVLSLSEEVLLTLSAK